MTTSQRREYDYRFTERVAILLVDFDAKKGSLKNATKRAEEIANQEAHTWLQESLEEDWK